MKRPDVSTLVGVSLIAAGVFGGSMFLAGSSAGAGSTVVRAVVQSHLEPARATAGIAPAAVPTAVASSPAAGIALTGAPAVTPKPPALGNAGLVVTVSATETAQVLTTDQWQLIQAAFPTNTYTMARIAFCESRFKDAIVGEGRYVGWFQIDPAHAPGADLTNPAVNVLVASYLAAIKPDLSDWPLTRFGCADWNKAEASTR